MPRIVTPAQTPPQVKGAPRPGFGDHDFDEVEHIVREEDPDTALCGVDQTDVPWDQGFPPCFACLEVMKHEGTMPGQPRGGLN